MRALLEVPPPEKCVWNGTLNAVSLNLCVCVSLYVGCVCVCVCVAQESTLTPEGAGCQPR